MRISAQEEYGLRCLLQLARAEAGHATIPEVASAEGLSQPYVAKLLAVLRQAGLVESARGRTGGYRLARPAAEISVGGLLLVLGEPLFEEPSYCQQHAGSESAGGCVHLGNCNLRSLWQTLELWMRRALDSLTLADLLEEPAGVAELLRTRLAEAMTEPESAGLITLSPLARPSAAVAGN